MVLVACDSADPGDSVQLVPPAVLESEVAVAIEGPATITNIHEELDLVVGEISFDPPLDQVQWFGEGPWTIAPGDSREIRVWFKPDAEGSLSTNLQVLTDAGTVTAPISLLGLPPVDGDGDGFSEALGDCNDEDPSIFPGAEELCDGIDNDCDDDIDGPFDGDRDGYVDEKRCPASIGPLDCNDNDLTAFPGNTEECDGSDSDCNGVVDDIDALADLQLGVCTGTRKVCKAGGATEPDYFEIEGYESLEFTCDSLDNDCDGGTDDFDRLGDGTLDCVDDDGDGEREVDGDCDDSDPRKTSANCGVSTLVVTDNLAGFSTIDLNSGRVTTYSLGLRTFHGVATDPNTLWFAARDEERIVRYDISAGTAWASSLLARSPWAVESTPSGDLMVLFGDGAYQRRNATTGGFIREVALSGSPTAWTADVDGTYWVCSASGEVHHISPTAVLDTVELDTPCYSSPALKGSRLVIPGFDDSVLIELNTATLGTTRARVTERSPIRAAWVGGDLWTSTSAEDTVDIYNGGDLLFDSKYDFDGQTQGLWHDDLRGLVWVAIFGEDEVISIDERTGVVRSRLTVPAPIHLFPVPPS